jgi:hypothetical protein
MLDELDKDMHVRPSLKRDAILGHDASWGDRKPPWQHHSQTVIGCQITRPSTPLISGSCGRESYIWTQDSGDISKDSHALTFN